MKFHTFYTVPLILTFVFVWHARAEGSSLVFVNVVSALLVLFYFA